jgi:hypothetical protein
MFVALAFLDLSGLLPAASLVLEPAAGVALGAAALSMVRASRPHREPAAPAAVLQLPVQRTADLREVRPEATDRRV